MPPPGAMSNTASTAEAKSACRWATPRSSSGMVGVVRDEHPDGAGAMGGGEIGARVADHHARRRCDAEEVGGHRHQARARLSAGAAVLFVVRTTDDHVEWAQQLTDPRVDTAQLLVADQLTGDAALVGDHADAQARRSRQPQRFGDTGKRLDARGVVVVGHIDDQRAVAVTEQRFRASRRTECPHGASVPDKRFSIHEVDRAGQRGVTIESRTRHQSSTKRESPNRSAIVHRAAAPSRSARARSSSSSAPVA